MATFTANSATCTYQGCPVPWTGNGFRSPCHGATYHAGGKVTGGPAPAPPPPIGVAVVNGQVYTTSQGSSIGIHSPARLPFWPPSLLVAYQLRHVPTRRRGSRLGRRARPVACRVADRAARPRAAPVTPGDPRGDTTRTGNEAAHVRAQCATRDHLILGRC
jgi:hypothetical protein